MTVSTDFSQKDLQQFKRSGIDPQKVIDQIKIFERRYSIYQIGEGSCDQ